MDQFERQFEHLDVQTQTMDEAMSGVTTLTTPEVLFLTLTLTFPHTIVCLIRGHVGTRTIDTYCCCGCINIVFLSRTKLRV